MKLKELGLYILDNINQIKTAGLYSSVGSCLIFIKPSNKVDLWIQTNIDYITIAILFVAVAHVLGSVVHWLYKGDFDWKKNIIGFTIMLTMVVVVGFVMEALAHITKEENFIYMYIKMIGRLIVCIYPARSILRNVKIVTNGAFPSDALIGKMDRFNENLDVNEFKNKEQ